VRKHAAMQDKRPSRILLDQNAHGPAARKLPEGTRRGRPDIVHYSLLTLLESPLAKSGGLEVAVHTRDGTLVRIRNDTRLPRGELRFHGLLAKVLVEGASHDKDPLLWVEGRLGPEEVLATFAAGPVLRLDEGGSPLEPTAIAARAQAG
jgi:rRNA small subunit pseudouridine methyltransferase Nep1